MLSKKIELTLAKGKKVIIETDEAGKFLRATDGRRSLKHTVKTLGRHPITLNGKSVSHISHGAVIVMNSPQTCVLYQYGTRSTWVCTPPSPPC